MYRASCALVALLSTITLSHARLVNVTIDDTYGDAWTGRKVVYSDSVEGRVETWNGVTNTDPGRPVLFRGFDWEKPENGSLHFTLAEKEIKFSIDFEGSAIYVFFILFSGATTNLTWFVDDNSTTESFTHKDTTEFSDVRSFYTYNVPIFSRENLDDGHHQAVISTSPIVRKDSGISMQSFFDYALYTTDTDAIRPGNGAGGTALPRGTTQTKQHRTATIIAVSLVCGILIAAGAFGYLWRRWRLRRAAAATTPWNDNGGVPEPYPVSMEGARGGKAVSRALFHAKGSNESGGLEPYPVGGPRTEKAFLWGRFEKPARGPRQGAKVQFEKPVGPAARLTEPGPALEPGSSTATATVTPPAL